MTTWPSATKATTTSIDSGTDNPNLSRAQIKQNFDNVNDVIDMFDMDGLANNDLMTYNATDTNFQDNRQLISEAYLSAVDLIGGSETELLSGTVTTGTIRYAISEDSDQYGFVSLRSDSMGFILQPGRYFIELNSIHGPGITIYDEEYGKPHVYFYPQRTDADFKTQYHGFLQDIGTDTEYQLRRDHATIVLPGNVSIGSDTNAKIRIKITKLG